MLNISPFFRHFLGNGDYSSYRKYLGKQFSYSKRAVHLLLELQVSYGVPENLKVG
jgi:hypothetical protein